MLNFQKVEQAGNDGAVSHWAVRFCFDIRGEALRVPKNEQTDRSGIPLCQKVNLFVDILEAFYVSKPSEQYFGD